jgi:hypothetical protein
VDRVLEVFGTLPVKHDVVVDVVQATEEVEDVGASYSDQPA